MKVVLYLASSVNGIIAGEHGETPWSREEWENYRAILVRVGNVVIGRKTFEVMLENNEFSDLPDIPVTVVGQTALSLPTEDFSQVGSPEEAVALAEAQGFSEMVVGGGAKLVTSFIKKRLADELIVDVEPRVLPQSGVPMILEGVSILTLQLFQVSRYGESGVQLRYKLKEE